jgi:hypothetical protein
MQREERSNPTHYKTEKLTFAAYLMVALKAELVGVAPIGNSRNCLFILSKAPSQEQITGFFNGTARVPALKYAEAVNSLKSIAYEARR